MPALLALRPVLLHLSYLSVSLALALPAPPRNTPDWLCAGVDIETFSFKSLVAKLSGQFKGYKMSSEKKQIVKDMASRILGEVRGERREMRGGGRGKRGRIEKGSGCQGHKGGGWKKEEPLVSRTLASFLSHISSRATLSAFFPVSPLLSFAARAPARGGRGCPRALPGPRSPRGGSRAAPCGSGRRSDGRGGCSDGRGRCPCRDRGPWRARSTRRGGLRTHRCTPLPPQPLTLTNTHSHTTDAHAHRNNIHKHDDNTHTHTHEDEPKLPSYPPTPVASWPTKPRSSSQPATPLPPLTHMTQHTCTSLGRCSFGKQFALIPLTHPSP